MTEAQQKQQGRITPAYAPWGQVKEFLIRMRALNPKTIDVEYLNTNITSGKDAYALFAAIKFLGFIDENGNCTDKLDSIKVRGETQQKKALENVVREAYADIFEAVHVEESDRSTIYNQMRSVYGCSTRIASSATPLFLALCEVSGITTGQQLARPAPRRAPVRRETGKRPSVRVRAASQPLPYTFTINVVQGMSEDDILSLLVRAENARRRFEREASS